MTSSTVENPQRVAADSLTFKQAVLLGLLMLIAASMCVYIGTRIVTHTSPMHIANPVRLSVSATSMIGNGQLMVGRPQTQYTLIEFADYECPACQVRNDEVYNIWKLRENKIHVVFRNLPLKQHPFALPAATAAVAAGQQGRFRQMHDAMMRVNQNLNESVLRELALRQGVGLRRWERDRAGIAKSIVQKDTEFANALHIHSTPTFILCCPNGDVFQLGSLQQLETLVH